MAVIDPERLDPHLVQSSLVAMLFDPEHAASLARGCPEIALSAREQELLQAIDPRALAVDAFRRGRALAALVDEFPVTIALHGSTRCQAFFASPRFRRSIVLRERMALAFGAWIGERERGIGVLETAMATVRRATPPRALGLVCAPSVRACVVPEGTLAFHADARDRLGPEPAATIAAGALQLGSPPRRGSEHVIVEAKPDGSIDVGTASAALVRLLQFAERERSHAELAAHAVRCGAEADEADALLDDLCAQGLLAGR